MSLVLLRLLLCQKSVLVLLESRPTTSCCRDIRRTISMQSAPPVHDQVGMLVFQLFDCLHLRVPPKFPFFAVAFRNELLRRRPRPLSPSPLVLPPDHVCLNYK
jgi:hypothetical protein